ncbi:hypothetical protein CDCA_CDCA01G0325 [Cyanidium caldarium]|uniref:PPIase cyclophilin-type domain-containing protein n=1 Tax=Cyanidium caldarium TaxID=2771 RepID=A0AAV9IQC7_CYACA|nr:hypothetical protein CDCA_CDCA01G0325 [Cyanidium caldarium]
MAFAASCGRWGQLRQPGAGRVRSCRVSGEVERASVWRIHRLEYGTRLRSGCLGREAQPPGRVLWVARPKIHGRRLHCSLGADDALTALRRAMRELQLDAFIVPTADPHQSEFPSECFARRAFLTGFTGSAGTALVLAQPTEEALLWTDGRYFLQAEQQLSSAWQLMRSGLPETPTLESYLLRGADARAPKRSPPLRVGIDPLLHSVASVRRLLQQGIQVVPLDTAHGVLNPVDGVWGTQRPPLPRAAVREHPLEHAGRSVSDKLHEVRDAMPEGVDGLWVSMLDDIGWLFNIRGADIPHCPVALAYALVWRDGSAVLFLDESKLQGAAGEAVRQRLQEAQVLLMAYEQCVPYLEEHCGAAQRRLWMDPGSTSLAMALAATANTAESPMPDGERLAEALVQAGQRAHLAISPVPLMKAVKNDAELAGMRAAHIRDGAALCRFLYWLEQRVAQRATDGHRDKDDALTEYSIGERLEAFRAADPTFVTTAFDTIAGSGPNGAIIHYCAEADTCRRIRADEVLLLDSGGQYVDGTTDVTRTMFLRGSADDTTEPDAFVRECYTRVLRGHIALDTAVFPEGTAGCMLDSFARRELWRAGLDYRHGTGHGVGAALNVHEGPQSISMRVSVPAVGLQPGMVVSNEPGYYQDGAFGIRLENLLVVREVSTPARFGDRRYLGFERLTLVPFDKQLMDLHMLSASEMDWVDAYHAQVLATVGSYLAEREEGEVLRWLERACAPLARPPRASGSPVRNGQEGRGGGIAERWLGAAIVALVLGGLTWASAALWTPPVRAAEVVVPTPNPSITAPDTDDASGQQPDRPRRLSLLTEEPRITHRCYLDVAIADQPAGRIVIGVYADEAPQSAQCFLSMCERGYAGTDVYRILSGFTVQVGPPPTTSSSSASRCAPDEPRLRHDRLGAVSLVRDAQQRSNGRFFITTRDDSGYLDGKYTVFGRVLEGMEVVRRVEQVGSRGPSNAPKKPVHIVAAGVLPP